MTGWAERRRVEALERDHDRDRDRRIALTVPCLEAGCAAVVGAECLNLRTREPLENQAAHDKRIKAGKAASTEDTGNSEAGRPE